MKFSEYQKESAKQWEDAAANSVAGGGVSLPADMKPKKKPRYDARTKEGKQFISRILQRREAKKLKEQEKINKANLDSIKTKV